MVTNRRMSKQRITATFYGVVACLLLCSCAAPARNALPEALVPSARIAGIDRAYDWGDQLPTELDSERIRALERLDRLGPDEREAFLKKPINYLAISGGGSDGAFGAGILSGWSKAGTRPEFNVVTGISTGAIIAPFAFLGSDYDGVLREIYTQYRTEDALQYRSALGTLFGDSAADATGMQTLIRKYIDAEVIKAIAKEHKNGRTLIIGTTNLDAGRPVIWNIGRIAASGTPHALPLIQDIIQASAAIPGVFPPVMIEYIADGKRYQEMHVDGGVTRQVFLFSGAFQIQEFLRELGYKGTQQLYIILNGSLAPRRDVVKANIFAISARSIRTLIQNQSVGDLYRLYLIAQKNNMAYQLMHIPPDFSKVPAELFDREYMQALFDLGFKKGLQSDDWQREPPEFNTTDVVDRD